MPELEQSPEFEQSSDLNEGQGPLESGEGQGEGGGEPSSTEEGGAAGEPAPETVETLREKLQSIEAERDEWKTTAEKRTNAFDKLMSESQKALREARETASRQRESLESIKGQAETWTDQEGKVWVHLNPEQQKKYDEGLAKLSETNARINELDRAHADLARTFQGEVQGRLAKDLNEFRLSAKVTDEEYSEVLYQCGMRWDANGNVIAPAFPGMKPAEALSAIKDIIRGRFASRNANILARELQKTAEAKAAGKKERQLPGAGSATRLGVQPKESAKGNLMRGILEVGFGQYA